jgi:hypothetical protein
MREFVGFPKIPRLYKGGIIVTEKIDGTNASILIEEHEKPDTALGKVVGLGVPEGAVSVETATHTYFLYAGSRARWLWDGEDNFGFWQWMYQNASALAVGLGEGHHFGEWWGRGIQRGYHQTNRTFSLFNTGRWYDPVMPNKVEGDDEGPEAIPPIIGLSVVPILYIGPWFGRPADPVSEALRRLKYSGSTLDPNTESEGVVVYHEASGHYYKAPFGGERKGI